jgi:hypothetical protein
MRNEIECCKAAAYPSFYHIQLKSKAKEDANYENIFVDNKEG